MEDGDSTPYKAQQEKFKNMDLFIELGIIAVMFLARMIKEYKEKGKQ